MIETGGGKRVHPPKAILENIDKRWHDWIDQLVVMLKLSGGLV